MTETISQNGHVQVDPSQAAEFFKTLLKGAEGEGTEYVITAIRDGRVDQRRVSCEDTPVPDEELCRTHNLYTTYNRFGADTTGRKAADVTTVTGIAMDLDIKAEDVVTKKGTKSWPRTRDELKAVMDAVAKKCHPTMEVDSGSGGLHVYWLFNRPMPRTETLEQLADQFRLWVNEIATKTLERTITFDSVMNLDRVFRVPGTIRHPKVSKAHPDGDLPPSLVKLVYNNGPRYSPAGLRELSESAKKPKAEKTVREKAPSKSKPSSGGSVTEAPPKDHYRVEPWIETTVESVISEYASIRETGMNNGLNEAAMTLGGLAAYGYVDRDEIYDRLIEASDENGLLDGSGGDGHNSRMQVDATFESGWSSGLAAPYELPEWMSEIGEELDIFEDDAGEEVKEPPAWKTPEIRKLLANPKIKEEAQRAWYRHQGMVIVKAMTASEAVQEKPEAFSLTDLLAQPQEASVWRLGGLLPMGGRVVLAAARKAGKTTLIGNLVKSLVDAPAEIDPFDTSADDFLMGVVNGFLGRSRVHDVPGKVVVIDNEMSPAKLQQWYRELEIEHTDRVEIWPLRGKAASFNIIEKSVRAQWAERLKGASFLILDCLAPFLAALGLEETNGDVGKFLEAVDALMAEAGISDLVLVHHMGHGDERSRGASRLRDWPDAEWKLVRERDGNGIEIDNGARFFSAYGRDVDCPESELEYNQATRTLSVKGGNRVQKKLTKDRGPVMDVIRREPGLGRNEIIASLSGELSGDRVKKALLALVQSGEIHTAFGERRKIHHFDGTDHVCADQKGCSKLEALGQPSKINDHSEDDQS